MLMRHTGENKGDSENDKDTTVETHTEGCPGQRRLKQEERNTEEQYYHNYSLCSSTYS